MFFIYCYKYVLFFNTKLKIWLEGFISHTEKKIENMKRVVPDHRNIKRFEGEVSMAKKTVDKIDELSKK